MKQYKAVVITTNQESTLKYTSKPYNTKQQALNDLNQELKRATKKGKTITLAVIEETRLPKEIAKMLLGGVATLEEENTKPQEPQAKEDKLEALEKHLKQTGEYSFLLDFSLNPGKALGVS